MVHFLQEIDQNINQNQLYLEHLNTEKDIIIQKESQIQNEMGAYLKKIYIKLKEKEEEFKEKLQEEKNIKLRKIEEKKEDISNII